MKYVGIQKREVPEMLTAELDIRSNSVSCEPSAVVFLTVFTEMDCHAEFKNTIIHSYHYSVHVINLLASVKRRGTFHY
jgi:hypothetical protein